MNLGEGPLDVIFGPCDPLKVELQLVNFPEDYNYYEITKQNSNKQVSRERNGVMKGGITQFKFEMSLNESDDLGVLNISLQRAGGTQRLTRELVKLKLTKHVIARNRPCMEIKRSITVHWGSTTRSDTDRSSVEKYSAAGLQSTPRYLYFKDGDSLDISVTFENLPKNISFVYDFYFENNSSMHRLDGIKLRLNATMDRSYLTVKVCFTLTQECDKNYTLGFIRLMHHESRTDLNCLWKPCNIILDWENKYLTDIPPPGISMESSLPGVSDKIWVTPQTSHQVCGAFAVFTCNATGDSLDLLSWYQEKGNNSRLVMKQFPKDTSKASMSLILNKTITKYDEDSSIYCMLRKARGANTFFSQNIRLTFCSTIQLGETPYITVQPASNVTTFSANTTRSFECGGSRPADSRSFNWYIEDAPYSNNFSRAPAENMVSHSNTNKVILTLYLNESYHSKRIYCVQEYHMNIECLDDTFYYWDYGENVRSHEIQLLMVPEAHHITVADNFKNGIPQDASGTQVATLPPGANTERAGPARDAAATGEASRPDTPAHQGDLVKHTVIGCSCVVILILTLVIIRYRRRFRKQEHRNEIAENINSRAPIDLPPDVVYDEVYSHGAGLKRAAARLNAAR